MTRARTVAGTIAAACVLAWLSSAQAQRSESELKAQLVERFTQFVEWPDGALGEAHDLFVICVLGQHAVGPYLDRMTKRRRFKNHAATVVYPRQLADVRACHVLFIAPGESGRLGEIQAETATRPVLLIGDTRGFAEKGVHINFYYQVDRKLGFEINPAAVKRSGLKVNAQLIKLARLVTQEGGP